MRVTAGEIATLVCGSLTGDADILITGVASVGEATPGDIVLADSDKFIIKGLASAASCVVAGLGTSQKPANKAVIEVENPAEAFVKVLELFRGEEYLPPVGIGSSAVIEQGVVLGKNVAIGANCFISCGAEIGDDCVIFPNVFIGENVHIGDGSKLYPGVTVYAKCNVGKCAILHAGVVVGADGFGYKPTRTGLMKLPHAGTVKIGDDVEIGANSAIDRAKTGATVIGNGTKIDNLVHIAHNVKIGSHCVIVALSGIAGSAEIGSGVTLAAQSGIKDHVRIEDGVTVAARAGVIGNIAQGAVVSGFPARDHRTELRVQAAKSHLPEIMERLKFLENEVAKLRSNEGSGADESV